jgi:hypothetical protein
MYSKSFIELAENRTIEPRNLPILVTHGSRREREVIEVMKMVGKRIFDVACD